jgi:hypothetical protein
MSFFDNLDNNLKNLEAREERESQNDRTRRDAEERAARESAPHAEQLKNSPFTQELLAHATRLGFAQRTKVHIAWLGTTLRLEAREKRLELRPTPKGVVAAYFENGVETRSEPVNLDGDPEKTAREWLT